MNIQLFNKLQKLRVGFQREMESIDKSINVIYNERAELTKAQTQEAKQRDEHEMVLDAAYLIKHVENETFRESVFEGKGYDSYTKVLYREMEQVSSDELDEIINVYETELDEIKTSLYNRGKMIESCTDRIISLYGEKVKPARAKSAIQKNMDLFISVVPAVGGVR